jgi:membrane-bound metal-dependent hydrolase YbcI (DUF457 family)
MGPAHLGIGLAAKPLAPKLPLWMLLVASELLDLLSFVFVAFDIEKMGSYEVSLDQGLQFITPGSIPLSHGLLMSVLWSALVAAVAYLFFKDRRSSLILGSVVFSHWVLDFIVHAPDLPLLFEGSPLVGLGLWTSDPGFIASMILELVLFGGGFAVYWIWRKREAKLERAR